MPAADLDAAADLGAFIDASPSPFHAVAAAAGRLDTAGFAALDETDAWDPDAGRHYVVRDGSLVAWTRSSGTDPAAPWRLIGAHTDSPNLRVKPRPDTGKAGARQLAIEVYGGVLLNSWLDRDLGLSGRIARRDGSTTLLLVDEPVARIPQLAIHLDREILTNGLLLNAQSHLAPIWGVGEPTTGAFRAYVADRLSVEPGDVVAWDLMLHDLTPSRVIGPDRDLLSAPRLDNLCSCWAAIGAIASSPPATGPAMAVLFDHEEVGSTSSRGADSPLVEAVLERIILGAGGTRADLRRALAGSMCASADMAHATHPNYPERHEPGHWIVLNGGPVAKSNVNQRYASDARTVAALQAACAEAGVPLQQFVSRNDMPCGSTIGPITAARLGIATVDVGAPQLAMHSARELMGSADPARYHQMMTAWLRP